MSKTRPLKGLAKSAKGRIATGARRVMPKAKSVRISKVLNRKWQDMEYHIGGKKFVLDDKGMDYILKRHHPDFWAGKSKAKQTFFPKDMSIQEIKETITTVMKQNRDVLERRGTDGMYQIEGVVNGVRYTLGLDNGRIGQFYPW